MGIFKHCEEQDEMVCVGFYIAKLVKKPDWCTLNAEKILSLGGCIGENQPDLTKCYYINYPRSSKEEYRKQLGLNKEQFDKFSNVIAGLINDHKLALDGRFDNYTDATEMYSYFQEKGEYMLLGLFTKKAYALQLEQDGFFKSVGMSATTKQGELLGCEILGSEMMGEGEFYFNSYLDNSLEEEISNHFELQTDVLTGLIKNHFEEVEKFLEVIQGMGEPVTWMPYQIYKYEKS